MLLFFSLLRVRVVFLVSQVQMVPQDLLDLLAFKGFQDLWVNLGQKVDRVNLGNQVFQVDQETKDLLDSQDNLELLDLQDYKYIE